MQLNVGFYYEVDQMVNRKIIVDHKILKILFVLSTLKHRTRGFGKTFMKMEGGLVRQKEFLLDRFSNFLHLLF